MHSLDGRSIAPARSAPSGSTTTIPLLDAPKQGSRSTAPLPTTSRSLATAALSFSGGTPGAKPGSAGAPGTSHHRLQVLPLRRLSPTQRDLFSLGAVGAIAGPTPPRSPSPRGVTQAISCRSLLRRTLRALAPESTGLPCIEAKPGSPPRTGSENTTKLERSFNRGAQGNAGLAPCRDKGV